MTTVDVGKLIDGGHWSRYQKLLIFGTVLTIILIGWDYQLLYAAIGPLTLEWRLSRDAFSSVAAVGPIGIMVGSVLGGMLGDRIGRRRALLWSVIALAALSLTMAAVDSLFMFGVLRFFFGVGFGGVMPNATALAYECAPKRKRILAVILTTIGVSIGSILAACLTGWILSGYGWRALFLLSGMAPLLLALMLFRILPESPLFLASRSERRPELIVVLRRFGHSVPEDATFTESAAASVERPVRSMRDLFAPLFLPDTLGLLGSFFSCVMANAIAIQCLPMILVARGLLSSIEANQVLSYWHLGGVGGGLLGTFFVRRFGSRISMLGMSAASVVVAIVLTYLPAGSSMDINLVIALVLLGGVVNAVQTTLYVLAASLFPTEVRARGVGIAVVMSRIGIFAASFIGQYVLGTGGVFVYFGSVAIAMTLTLASLSLVRRHIESEIRTDAGAVRAGLT